MRALDRYRGKAESVVTSSEPSETHVRVVGFVDEMIVTMLGQRTGMTPLVRMLQRMRPALLADLSTIPADELRSFMVDLGRRMMLAGDPDSLNVPDDPAHPDGGLTWFPCADPTCSVCGDPDDPQLALEYAKSLAAE